MPTVLSGTAAYCTAAQMIERHDARILGDLLSEEGEDPPVRLSPDDVLTSDRLATALKQASGKVEMAVLLGERYTPTDLAALAGSNMGEILAGIVANLAFGILWQRRDPTADPPGFVEEADELLNAVSSGQRIFGFQETMEAGHMDHTVEQPANVEERNLATYQARSLFGTRGNRRGNR